MKKYLMTEVAEITDAQKEPREIYAYYEDEVRRIYFDDGVWKDCETAHHVDEEPKFYLPDGLPDPSQAVEVFEKTVMTTLAINDENGESYHLDYVEVYGDMPFKFLDKVMIYKKVQNG